MNKAVYSILLLLSPFFLFAQTLQIEQVNEPCSKGDQPAFRMLIPQGTLKSISAEWSRYLRAKSKAKTEDIAGETIIYGAVNKNIAPDGFNVISKLLETTEGVVITSWFMRSDSTFVSNAKDGNQVLAVEKYLHDFGVNQYKRIVKAQLQTENTKLSGMQSDLKSLINNEEKSNSKINANQRDIQRTKTQIETNLNDQKNKQDQIAQQKTVVESLRNTPGDALKAAEKTLKTMENELKKLVNENEKLHKQIDKNEKGIREEGRAIDTSKQDQNLKNTAIENQKAVVKALENKLKQIK